MAWMLRYISCGGMTAGVLRLLYEILFPYAADGAYPIVGDILEGGAGGDSSVGVAYRGVINPVAYLTSVLFHSLNILKW